MMGFALVVVLLGAHPQDPVVVTSGRDRPASEQRVHTSGYCVDVPVGFTIDFARREVIVSKAGIQRNVEDDLPELMIGQDGRWVARTYILCRHDGGLEVNLLFADGRDRSSVAWTLGFFKVSPDLREVSWGAEHPLSADEAASAIR